MASHEAGNSHISSAVGIRLYPHSPICPHGFHFPFTLVDNTFTRSKHGLLPNLEHLFCLTLYIPCIIINCIKSPTRCTFSCVFILKFALYMFRKDTPFIISSLHMTVYTAVCTYHADCNPTQFQLPNPNSYSQDDMYKHLRIQ